jgi:hypothetical protein
MDDIAQVRQVLGRFQDGYTTRDVSKLDEFMELFSPDDVELIGIGASVRGGNEWFEGLEAIREIVESDWTYWGDVVIDVEGARITVLGDVAWLSTSGDLVQTPVLDKAMTFYVQQMQEMIENENLDPGTRLMEATHFGLRRLREKHLGSGHRWPFVLTAVLARGEDGWRFRQVQFAMPVD